MASQPNKPQLQSYEELLALGLRPAASPAPMINGQPARPIPAPPVSSMPQTLTGTLPSTMQLDSDFAENQYGGQVPSYRLMPPASSGQAAVNSGVLNGSEAAAQAAYQAQQTANAAIAAAQLYAGVYTPLTLYTAGKIVSYNGLLYISLLNGNIGNEPDISPTWWQSTGTGGAFLGDWNSSTAYVIGNQVIDVAGGGGYYIATAANTNVQPSASPGYWTLITAGNLNSYEGAYNAGTAYTVGQIVSYGGAQYIAIQASTGQTPSAASSYWTLLGANALFMGAWSGTTAYTANMIVVYQNNLYQCIAANTNETPANALYWVLTGPATLDDLENGDIYIKGTLYQGQVLVIPNPNFQLTDTNDTGIAGWVPDSTATLTANQTSNPPQTNGTYCKITTSTLNAGMACVTEFKVAPGDIIFFGAYMIADGTFKIEGQCVFWDGARNYLSEIDIGNTTLQDWVFYSNTGTAPANTSFALIYFRRVDSSGGSQSAWVTDVQLACSSGVAPNNKSSLLNGQGDQTDFLYHGE